MNKTEVTFPSSDPSCRLCGDLYLPPSPSSPSALAYPSPSSPSPSPLPAIVIVAGSGPIDRNGNAPTLGMEFNTSNRFAEHMTSSSSSSSSSSCPNRPAERAVAVLSYDKRGVGGSKNHTDKNFYYRAGMMDLVMDAVEAVRFAARHPQIDKTRIVVLGHSEGAIIMPLICREVVQTGLDPLIGCIFYCGFGENLRDAMALQRETLVNEVSVKPGPTGWILRRLVTRERVQRQYDDLAKKVNAPHEPDYVSMQCGLVKHPAKWFREHMEYDVDRALGMHVTCHCLAVTGRKDFQVRNEFCEEDRATKLVPNAMSIEVHRPMNLTHALRSTEGPARMMDMREDYARMAKLPLDEGLLAITDAWCDRVLFGDEEGQQPSAEAAVEQ